MPLRSSPQAERAEKSGFAFASISDHFHPWVEEQGESPFVYQEGFLKFYERGVLPAFS
jgi:hypothetical protein